MSLWRAVMLILTLRCEESHRLMAEANERQLSLAERWAMRLHRLSCSVCRRLAKQLQLVDRFAKERLDSGAKLSDDAQARIRAELMRAEGE